MNKLKWLFVLVIFIAISSCNKYNQIDTSGTIKVPYVLYMGGVGGDVYQTNDASGTNYNTVFSYDGSVTNQIVISDTNILLLKDYLSVSQKSKAFHIQPNVKLYHYNPLSNSMKLNYKNTSLWDTKNSKTYLCQTDGLIYRSLDDGVTWKVLMSPNDIDSSYGYSHDITSVTQTNNNNVYFLTKYGLTFRNGGGSGVFNLILPDVNGSGTPINQLPINFSSTPSVSDSFWTISHSANNLIAYNYNLSNSVYYSNNEGKDWYACSGVPANSRKLFGNQTLGGVYFLGTDSAGLYKLDVSGTNFIHTDGGLPPYARVYDVVGKRNVYNTDFAKYYYFAATDQGLYMSLNGGEDWQFVHTGSYTALW